LAVAPQISDAEWDVMKVVWERQPVPASDVVEQLGC
jgi:predicted transcriptional regulator